MTTKVTLLIIDENAAVNLMCCTVLERRGYKTISAMDGQFGLNILQQKAIDAVILESRMINISGIEVLRDIRKSPNTADIPVIVTSADRSPAIREQFEILGCSAYLHKPIIFNSLFKQIEQVLYARR